MKKKIETASAYPDNYEIYDDGSMKAECKRCKNFEEVPAERAEKIRKIPDWSSSFTCTPCWRKSKEPANQDTQDRIAYAQSWNLAVALVAPQMTSETDERVIEVHIEHWQEYFHKKLTNRN